MYRFYREGTLWPGIREYGRAERHDERHNVGRASRLSSGLSVEMVREYWGARHSVRAQENRRDACPTFTVLAPRPPPARPNTNAAGKIRDVGDNIPPDYGGTRESPSVRAP